MDPDELLHEPPVDAATRFITLAMPKLARAIALARSGSSSTLSRKLVPLLVFAVPIAS